MRQARLAELSLSWNCPQIMLQVIMLYLAETAEENAAEAEKSSVDENMIEHYVGLLGSLSIVMYLVFQA